VGRTHNYRLLKQVVHIIASKLLEDKINKLVKVSDSLVLE
jgi:hypothetical protein